MASTLPSLMLDSSSFRRSAALEYSGAKALQWPHQGASVGHTYPTVDTNIVQVLAFNNLCICVRVRVNYNGKYAMPPPLPPPEKGKADLTTVSHIRELPHLHMKLAVWFSFPTTNNKNPNDSFLKSCVHLQLFLQPRPNLYQELWNIGARNMLQNFYMWHDIFGSH